MKDKWKRWAKDREKKVTAILIVANHFSHEQKTHVKEIHTFFFLFFFLFVCLCLFSICYEKENRKRQENIKHSSSSVLQRFVQISFKTQPRRQERCYWVSNYPINFIGEDPILLLTNTFSNWKDSIFVHEFLISFSFGSLPLLERKIAQ